jgi:hypothetical protein
MLSTSVEHTRRSLLAAATVIGASNAFSAVARAASEEPQIEAIRPFSVDAPLSPLRAEPSAAQRGCVSVDAQDFGEAAALCSARRARRTPAARGSARKNASSKARPAPAANSGSPCPAVPLARAHVGLAPAETFSVPVFLGSSLFVPASRAPQVRVPEGLECGRRAA